MPWPKMIKSVREAFLQVREKARRLEQRSFHPLEERRNKMSRSNRLMPRSAPQPAPETPAESSVAANNVMALLRQSLPVDLLQDSEDALHDVIRSVNVLKPKLQIGGLADSPGKATGLLDDLLDDADNEAATRAALARSSSSNKDRRASNASSPSGKTLEDRSPSSRWGACCRLLNRHPPICLRSQ